MKLSLLTTTFPNNFKKETEQYFDFAVDDNVENDVVNIYPEMEYQIFEGFGGAITDSAGYVYSQMSEKQKARMISTYFDHDEMDYQIVRIPMDSCDFSTEYYEAMSNPSDRTLSSFDMTGTEKYIIPLLEDICKITGKKIKIMLTPWSPPAFMKTNGKRNHGGKLKETYKAFWADYICKYIENFRMRGYKVTRMSLQNEPNAVQAWDSCTFAPKEEKDFLRNYMYPALQAHGLDDMEVFIWDHNKERAFERACAIIDEDTNHMIQGIAFHWYSGDHFDALNLIHEKFPDKKLILSEACVEYNKFSKENGLANAQKYAHEIIGNLNGGMTGFYDWNILLNELGGPNTVFNYCEAPFLFDTKEHELTECHTLTYLRHFSHFIAPGAVRIASTKYTDKLEVVAMKNPNGMIIVIILNSTKELLTAAIRMDGKYTKILIQPESIVTAQIQEEYDDFSK